MPLDIEIAGRIRDLSPDEISVNRPVRLKSLRDSHHAVAKLLAAGLTPLQVSLQTGYSPSRISSLQLDPTFQDLLEQYRAHDDEIAAEVEKQFLLVAKDAMQAIHEEMLDNPEEIPASVKLDIFKAFADRAGFAPVQRSISKTLNMNIGDMMDAINRRKKEAA